MIFSGNSSPTLTESNSRSAIVEATLSVFFTTPRKGGVGLLDYFAILVGDDVLGDDDVRAVRPAIVVRVHVAVQPVTHLDRVVERQYLVNLNDLLVVDTDAGVLEERELGAVAEHRDERQRPQ